MVFIDSDLVVFGFFFFGDPWSFIFDLNIVEVIFGDQVFSNVFYVVVDWELVFGFCIIFQFCLLLEIYVGKIWMGWDLWFAIWFKVYEDWIVIVMGVVVHQFFFIFQIVGFFGDPNILLVCGSQVSMGFEWSSGDGWEIKLEGFYNYFYNMVRFFNDVVIDEEIGDLLQFFW